MFLYYTFRIASISFSYNKSVTPRATFSIAFLLRWYFIGNTVIYSNTCYASVQKYIITKHIKYWPIKFFLSRLENVKGISSCILWNLILKLLLFTTVWMALARKVACSWRNKKWARNKIMTTRSGWPEGSPLL